jgi:integrase
MEVIEMASIRQRGKDSYAVVFQNGDESNRHQVWESGYTKDEAKARKAQIEFEEARGIKTHAINDSNHNLLNKSVAAAQAKKAAKAAQVSPVDAQAMTEIENADNSIMFIPFMEEFIRIYGAKKWGEPYYSSGINLLKNYVYEYWTSSPITKITVKAIDDYYTWLVTECKAVTNKYKTKNGEFVSPSTVNDVHKILRCAFNKAVKWQHLKSNPFLDATIPEYKSKVRPALTPSEIDRVFEYTDNPDNYNLYLIHCAMNLAFAGSMRGGEIGALQWDDIVDQQRRILFISKTIDRVDKAAMNAVSKTEVYYKFPCHDPRSKSFIVLKNTKEDGGSDRNCYLPVTVYEKLMRFKEMQIELKNLLGDDGYYDYGMMLCQENGKPVMTEHLNKKFQSVLNEMGIKPKKGNDQYVFHSIRSTATTYKLKISGGDIKAVQGENGQKDAKMVTHQYSRILEEDRSRIADIMDEKFYGRKDSAGEDELLQAVKDNPDLLKQFMAFMALAKNAS